jgi:hypothetical protein
LLSFLVEKSQVTHPAWDLALLVDAELESDSVGVRFDRATRDAEPLADLIERGAVGIGDQ